MNSMIEESPEVVLEVLAEIKRQVQPGRGRLGPMASEFCGVITEKRKWSQCAQEIGWHWVLYPGCDHVQMKFFSSAWVNVPLDLGLLVQKIEWFADLLLIDCPYAPIGFAPQIIKTSTSK